MCEATDVLKNFLVKTGFCLIEEEKVEFLCI
jgi:hypothetical protein